MDIKDFILIVGGALILAVIAHGFWTVWRAQREPLRMDIVPELIPDDFDEMDRFRGELPNGGARPVAPEQGSFDLGADADAPLLLEPSAAPDARRAESAQRAADRELFGDAEPAPSARRGRARPKGPDLFTIPEGYGPDDDALDPAGSSVSAGSPAGARVGAIEPKIEAAPESADGDRVADVASAASAMAEVGPAAPEPKRPRVAEVSLPEGDADSTVSTPEAGALEQDSLRTEARRELRPRRSAVTQTPSRPTHKPRRLGGLRLAANEPLTDGRESAAEAVEELILIHLVARRGETFSGTELCDALRAQGLKFGAMNIFHRIDPLSKVVQYSVANAVEPGFFDLSDLSSMSTPGMTFFLQLPGPEQPGEAAEDLIRTATAIAHQLGGELRDEARNRMTRQTAEHLKQRVSDFALKHLSRKAL